MPWTLKTAGTDFGNLACIPWAKGRLGLPYLCGGVRKSGTALMPSRDVVHGPENTLTANHLEIRVSQANWMTSFSEMGQVIH